MPFDANEVSNDHLSQVPQQASVGYGITLPLTTRTDPRRYPRYRFREYPKMLVVKADEAYVAAWRKRHAQFDGASREQFWSGVAPRVGSMQPLLSTQKDMDAGYAIQLGEPLVARSADDEAAIYALHGMSPEVERADVVNVDIPSRDELAQIEADNARLEAAIAKQAELKRKLAALTADDEPAAEERKPRAFKARQAKRRAKARKAAAADPSTEELPED